MGSCRYYSEGNSRWHTVLAHCSEICYDKSRFVGTLAPTPPLEDGRVPQTPSEKANLLCIKDCCL